MLAWPLLRDEVKVKVERNQADKNRRRLSFKSFNSLKRVKTMEEKNQLFTILQVSEKLNVPPHTLRFWEKELNGLLVPLRTHGGQRRYTPQNLAVLEEVKRCRESGLSLPEIISRILSCGEGESLPSEKINLLASRVAEAVKTEVYNFFKIEKENE
jgi:DNA-binding transcriptional MerR regulator